ncbi:hypothetical protein AAMO2058_000543300 [Amorphochlora amoebiformis]
MKSYIIPGYQPGGHRCTTGDKEESDEWPHEVHCALGRDPRNLGPNLGESYALPVSHGIHTRTSAGQAEVISERTGIQQGRGGPVAKASMHRDRLAPPWWIILLLYALVISGVQQAKTSVEKIEGKVDPAVLRHDQASQPDRLVSLSTSKDLNSESSVLLSRDNDPDHTSSPPPSVPVVNSVPKSNSSDLGTATAEEKALIPYGDGPLPDGQAQYEEEGEGGDGERVDTTIETAEKVPVDVSVPTDSPNPMASAEEKIDESVDEPLGGGSTEANRTQAYMRDPEESVNYAAAEKGAKILYQSENLRHAHSILERDKDRYMIAPCQEPSVVIIQLAEAVEVDLIRLVSWEYYAAGVDKFEILSLPPNEQSSLPFGGGPDENWTLLGKFVAAKNTRSYQTFNLPNPQFAQFIKLRALSWQPGESVCTLSALEAFGGSQEEQLMRHIEEHEQLMQKSIREREKKNTTVQTTAPNPSETKTQSDTPDSEEGQTSPNATSGKEDSSGESTRDVVSEGEREWVKCSGENETCAFDGILPIRFGSDEVWKVVSLSGPIRCTVDVFVPTDQTSTPADEKLKRISQGLEPGHLSCSYLPNSKPSQKTHLNSEENTLENPKNSTISQPSPPTARNGNIAENSAQGEEKGAKNGQNVKNFTSMEGGENSGAGGARQGKKMKGTAMQILAQKVANLELKESEVHFDLQEMSDEIKQKSTSLDTKISSLEYNYNSLIERLDDFEKMLESANAETLTCQGRMLQMESEFERSFSELWICFIILLTAFIVSLTLLHYLPQTQDRPSNFSQTQDHPSNSNPITFNPIKTPSKSTIYTQTHISPSMSPVIRQEDAKYDPVITLTPPKSTPLFRRRRLGAPGGLDVGSEASGSDLGSGGEPGGGWVEGVVKWGLRVWMGMVLAIDMALWFAFLLALILILSPFQHPMRFPPHNQPPSLTPPTDDGIDSRTPLPEIFPPIHVEQIHDDPNAMGVYA